MGRFRRRWNTEKKLLISVGGLIVLCTFYLSLTPIQEPCNCRSEQHPKNVFDKNSLSHTEQNNSRYFTEFKSISDKFGETNEKLLHKYDDLAWGQHRLAIIVPFRDRFEELLEFAPELHKFLNRQKIRHKIFVVNQVDLLRFNRGSLINVGYLISQAECDYIAMHDVDLIPINDNVSYAMPGDGPFHVSSPELHPRYHYETFVGGILLLKNSHFVQVNGFSNKYYGWGKEDDEFYVRIKEAKLVIDRPKNITTGYSTFKHIHDKQKRPRDNKRYFDQKMKSRIRDRITGLDTVMYEVVTRTDIEIESAPVTILNVELRCDLELTPWCVTMDKYHVIQEYLTNKDKLLPHDVYSKSANGSLVKVNTTLAKPTAPFDLHYFINLKRDETYDVR